MTREEAIKKHYKIKCHIEESKKILNLINEIYDSFENRSCKNCKYVFSDTLEFIYCSSPKSPLSSCVFPIHPNFSCNKWEQK